MLWDHGCSPRFRAAEGKGGRRRPALGPALGPPRAEGGQALVEFALLVPVMLFVLFGTIEFGRLFVSYLVMVEAAHEGARIASLGGTSAAVVTAADAAVQMAGLAPANLAVNVAGTPDGTGSWVSGTPVSIALSYPLPIIVPLFWPILGQSFTIHTAVTMLEEG